MAAAPISTPSPSLRYDAVIVAAGDGRRAGLDTPKQFAPFRGQPLLAHSVRCFASHGCARIVVVHPPGQESLARTVLAAFPDVVFATGGATRQESVRNGLAALGSSGSDMVLIHDAARPNVPAAVIDRLLEAMNTASGAIPALPVVDSLVRAVAEDGQEPVSRDGLHRVQTPQAFRRDAILAAHAAWGGAPDAGDDAEVLRAAGGRVALVPGSEELAKVTYAQDFHTDQPPMRVGTGFDVHRLVDGETLWLGGVRIPFPQGLSGHSDADVALHAITDAMLGALGAGDIGTHFPPSDPQWKGAASDAFLAHARSLAADRGYDVGNVDLTIICEAPKIGPHRPAMRQRIADILAVEESRISIKATTTEMLGFTGRGEGIAAQAVATLVKR